MSDIYYFSEFSDTSLHVNENNKRVNIVAKKDGATCFVDAEQTAWDNIAFHIEIEN